MSIVECKMCKETKAVYFHVPDKKNFTCDGCIRLKRDVLHAPGEGVQDD